MMGQDMPDECVRVIYYGDNLDILRAHVSAGSVDLVYLDPPFKSQQQYNLLFRTARGEPAQAQVRAFSDTWQWNRVARGTYDWLVENPAVPGKVSQMIAAFYQFLGPSEMLAYLVMMTPRLLELHRVLRRSGSLYLHCDPAASHYLKIVLDTIFGPVNFRNEINWRRTGAHGKSRRYAPIHDIILFYSKSGDYKWNSTKKPYMKGHIQEYFVEENGAYRSNYYGNVLTGSGVRHGESGRPWRGFDPTTRRRHWAVPRAVLDDIDEDLSDLSLHQKLDRLLELGYIKIIPGQAWPIYERHLKPGDGQAMPDIWAFQPYTEGTLFNSNEGIDADVRWLSPRDQERLGYPTQKPLGLLRRIIEASSDPGDLVLDPFCGCGTALAAAEELGRSWIGIDITYLAVDVMVRRLRDHFPGLTIEIRGEPQDEEGARALANRDRFQFQVWALSKIGAQSLDPQPRGADRGIDGYLPFQEQRGQHRRAVVQVKSGHVGVREVRDLRGTLEREGTPFAILITLEAPTEAMRREAAEGGVYRVPATGEEIPRVQIVTIRDLLRGNRPRVPSTQVSPVMPAQRIRRRRGRQLALGPSETEYQI
jgi:DNA modification methylase